MDKGYTGSGRRRDELGKGRGQRIHGERERTKDTYTYKGMIIVGEILGEYRHQETFRKHTKIYSYLQKPGC